MTSQIDFDTAIRQGVDAENNRRMSEAEVEAILSSLADALGRFLSQPVRVERAKKLVSSAPYLRGTMPASATSLVLRVGGDEHSLCEWEESALIFPVTLRFSKSVETAHDGEALEHALAALLATPRVGAILKQLKDEGAPAQP
jgi:hypothetical protein